MVGSIDTLKAQGVNLNCIMLLPNHFRSESLRTARDRAISLKKEFSRLEGISVQCAWQLPRCKVKN